MNPILDIKEPLREDDSIVDNQFYQFFPETGTQLNNPGNITLTVNNSDNFYHPANSFCNLRVNWYRKRMTHLTRVHSDFFCKLWNFVPF